MHITNTLYIADLPLECIKDCAASGDVSESVEYWRRRLEFTVDRDRAVKHLKGYGAWSCGQLAEKTDQEIAEIVLWLACGDFRQYLHYAEQDGIDPFNPPADYESSGSNLFYLE